MLRDSEQVLGNCVDRYRGSPLRIPGEVDEAQIHASLAPIVQAFAGVVAPDREGNTPSTIEFRPGLSALREIEQAVVFMASNTGSASQYRTPLASGFEVGALLFSLRDILSDGLTSQAAKEVQGYMEWLVVLAGDSLAHGREQAALERFSDELDAGTPLLMITPEVPAAIFVCSPGRRVIAGILGRLLLTMVRSGARAIIFDVSGVNSKSLPSLRESIEAFLDNPRVGGKSTVFICGVAGDDLHTWKELGQRVQATLVFENYFDICVQSAIELNGGRLISGHS